MRAYPSRRVSSFAELFGERRHPGRESPRGEPVAHVTTCPRIWSTQPRSTADLNRAVPCDRRLGGHSPDIVVVHSFPRPFSSIRQSSDLNGEKEERKKKRMKMRSTPSFPRAVERAPVRAVRVSCAHPRMCTCEWMYARVCCVCDICRRTSTRLRVHVYVRGVCA